MRGGPGGWESIASLAAAHFTGLHSPPPGRGQHSSRPHSPRPGRGRASVLAHRDGLIGCRPGPSGRGHRVGSRRRRSVGDGQLRADALLPGTAAEAQPSLSPPFRLGPLAEAHCVSLCDVGRQVMPYPPPNIIMCVCVCAYVYVYNASAQQQPHHGPHAQCMRARTHAHTHALAGSHTGTRLMPHTQEGAVTSAVGGVPAGRRLAPTRAQGVWDGDSRTPGSRVSDPRPHETSTPPRPDTAARVAGGSLDAAERPPVCPGAPACLLAHTTFCE